MIIYRDDWCVDKERTNDCASFISFFNLMLLGVARRHQMIDDCNRREALSNDMKAGAQGTCITRACSSPPPPSLSSIVDTCLRGWSRHLIASRFNFLSLLKRFTRDTNKRKLSYIPLSIQNKASNGLHHLNFSNALSPLDWTWLWCTSFSKEVWKAHSLKYLAL